MKRLESLDVLRGMDMFMILCAGWSPLIFLCEAFGMPDCWLVAQCHHAKWGAGVTIIDLVFPTFLFIAGVTFPYSLAHQREKGAGAAQIVGKVFRRMALLFALGIFYNHAPTALPLTEGRVLSFDFMHPAIAKSWSVIGRIGIAWGVAALVWFAGGRKAALCTTIGLLAAWWAICRFIPNPDAAPGVDTMAKSANYIGRWLDVNYFTVMGHSHGATDTVGMVPTALFGMLAGDFLRTSGWNGNRKTLAFLAAGAAGIVLSLVWEALPMPLAMPRIKGCWTSSYALFAGGVSAVALGLVYWVVDVRGWRKWGFFFKVIGVNPLTVYLLSWTVLKWEYEKEYFFGELMRSFPGPVMNCVAEWGTVGLFWLLLYYMYRKGMFLRV